LFTCEPGCIVNCSLVNQGVSLIVHLWTRV